MCLKYQLETCTIQGGQQGRYASQLNEGDFKTISTETSAIEGRQWCIKSAQLLVKGDVLAPNIGQGLVHIENLNYSSPNDSAVSYGPDQEVNAMACIDQYQIRNPNSSPYTCTVVESALDMHEGYLEIGLNDYQIATAQRLLYALRLTGTWGQRAWLLHLVPLVMRSTLHLWTCASLSCLGLMIVICVGLTIMILSWTVEPCVSFIRRKRSHNKHDYREIARIADRKLQLQAFGADWNRLRPRLGTCTRFGACHHERMRVPPTYTLHSQRRR
jgi:hypothetical protein